MFFVVPLEWLRDGPLCGEGWLSRVESMGDNGLFF